MKKVRLDPGVYDILDEVNMAILSEAMEEKGSKKTIVVLERSSRTSFQVRIRITYAQDQGGFISIAGTMTLRNVEQPFDGDVSKQDDIPAEAHIRIF